MERSEGLVSTAKGSVRFPPRAALIAARLYKGRNPVRPSPRCVRPAATDGRSAPGAGTRALEIGIAPGQAIGKSHFALVRWGAF